MRKRFLSLMLSIAVFCSVFCPLSANAATNMPVSAEAPVTDSGTHVSAQENVLKNVFTALDKHDYKKYTSLTALFCNDGQSAEKTFQADRAGVYNFKSIKLLKDREISENDTNGVVNLAQYPAKYSDVHVYSIALNCSLYKENEFFFNGVNYCVCVVGYDGDTYKLLQFSKPLWSKVGKAARFGDFEEQIQMFIENEKMKGNIIGSAGNLIEVNRESEKDRAQNEGLTIAQFEKKHPNYRDEYFVYKGTDGMTVAQYLKSNKSSREAISANKITVPYPSAIKVKRMSLNRIDTVNFETYVKIVTQCEWATYEDNNGGWHGMPEAALDAGIVCVREYGWYSYLNPRAPGSYNVRDDTADQVYNPNRTPSSTVSYEVSAMDGYAIVNSSGNVFCTHYYNGSFDSSLPTGSFSGYATQNGAAYLAQELRFTSWFSILNYYYDGISNGYY